MAYCSCPLQDVVPGATGLTVNHDTLVQDHSGPALNGQYSSPAEGATRMACVACDDKMLGLQVKASHTASHHILSAQHV